MEVSTAMGHCIQAIVTTADVAESLRAIYPQFPLVKVAQGFTVLPVDVELIDSVVEARPSQSPGTFASLTKGFQDLLLELSRLGPLAYIETDYFGGKGGQGAVVYSGREIVMAPMWRRSGPINRALRLIGVKRRLIGDRFSALGLGEFRCNDDLIEAASAGDGTVA